MNDIEKLSEKLKNHTVTPPPETWQTLAHGLQQKRRQRRAAYWSVAASLVLISAIVAWIGRVEQTNPERITRQVTTDSITVSKEMLAADNQHDKYDKGIDNKSEVKPVAEPDKPPATTPETVDTEPLMLAGEHSVTVPSPLAKAENETVVKEVSSFVEASTTQPTFIVEAARYRKSTPEKDTLEVTSRESAVTVIYQPNPATLAEKKSLGQKIDRTLTFLEEHGVSYSELRSAKSDLVNKLFSGKEPQEEAP